MTDAAAATPATLRRLAAMREYAEAGQEADPDDVLSLLDTLAARDAEVTRWREKCQILRSGLTEVLLQSPDCKGAEYARRTLAETSDVG